MIIPRHLEGQTIGVFGLARSGRAAFNALQAAGVKTVGFDDREDQLVDENTARWQDTDFDELDRLIVSPGVPLTGEKRHPVIDKAKNANLKICGDFDLFLGTKESLKNRKIIGITGTNGKSTTTALITHLIKENGRDSLAFGNIGVPFMAVKPLEEGGVYVAELSSFQLDLSPAPQVDIAVLLNVSPDHLDRHGTMENYAAAKAKLFQSQAKKLIAVISVDDPFSRQIAKSAGPYVVPFSMNGIVPGGVWVDNGMIVDGLKDRARIAGPLDDLTTLRGDHNGQNALAAYAVGRRLGFSMEGCFKALKSFSGLAHRQEILTTKFPFTVVNDSKATNRESAARALATFAKIRWIAGGRLKGDAPRFQRSVFAHVQKAYLYGEAGKEFKKNLPQSLPHFYASDFGETTRQALMDAKEGDTLLLSPSATAFDQFADFEKRGEAFKKIVANTDWPIHEGREA